jgi:hypothetical protein
MKVSDRLNAPADLPFEETAPNTCWAGCCVDPKAGLCVVKRKFLAPTRNRIPLPPSFPACSLVGIPTELFRFHYWRIQLQFEIECTVISSRWSCFITISFQQCIVGRRKNGQTCPSRQINKVKLLHTAEQTTTYSLLLLRGQESWKFFGQYGRANTGFSSRDFPVITLA